MSNPQFWSSFWQFANNNPGWTFLIVLAVCWGVANFSLVKHNHYHNHKGDDDDT